jgi:hypothetical protein
MLSFARIGTTLPFFSLAECVLMVVSDARLNAFHRVFLCRLASTKAAGMALDFGIPAAVPLANPSLLAQISNAKRDDGDAIDRSASIMDQRSSGQLY